MYSCDISTNFGGHFVFEFQVVKRQNRAWHGADLESAYPNCVKTTACQILLTNALTSQKCQKWALTIILKNHLYFFSQKSFLFC